MQYTREQPKHTRSTPTASQIQEDRPIHSLLGEKTMPYITISVSRQGEQISLEEILDNITNPNFTFSLPNPQEPTNDTKTVYVNQVPDRLLQNVDFSGMILALEEFNSKYRNLIETTDKKTLYRSFKIPKRSGGLRQIDAPLDELMVALRDLKFILEKKCYATHHTAAFAYVKQRSAFTALKRHQANHSRWFLKLDFSNFFGNTSFDFLMQQLNMIFPYSEIMKSPRGYGALTKALSLCFLNGGLPQGTPISPTLTNMMMIPIDLAISRYAREHKPHLCYTRYADDIQISSEYSFLWRPVQTDIVNILAEFHAPFHLNQEKTRYGSSAGRNWNLGLMLNKDNQITVGHQKKKRLKVMIYSLLNDFQNNVEWSVEDLQELQGIISYYKMIEKENIEKIIADYQTKFGLNAECVIRDLLSLSRSNSAQDS